MRDPITDYEKEFDELVGDLSETIKEMADPVSIATMLYSIAEERKSNNIIVREINAKFDAILEKLGNMDRIVERLERIGEQLSELNEKFQTKTEGAVIELSERDREILEFVRERKRVCADDIKRKFKYRGRNAASARLSKLFKDNLLEKVYVGRKVYYKVRD
ncbi:MAG: hypothetical protein DRO90_01420 [Candidatus Altiarchaeales archaeon]|nr:MAG: hypothetical protein DRO94_04405 [Candidatus Altiarchaeales archaeon]RLI94814.1 MAG: hypothetical protein DRO90_01420 [Candidatus Altiarchaeales archaeon]HDO82381.1 hypothetical protein [Candidatus Altiarchaeales archaeon]HEX55030.1 hypothetical protein [Candidatus Altiarchaeales archaeon]